MDCDGVKEKIAMRAIYYNKLDTTFRIGETFKYTGKSVHHLLNVARIKLEDQILLINGKGLTCNAQVKKIGKKIIFLKVLDLKQKEKKSSLISIAICLPKKDALEDVIRQATELGVSKIYLLQSEYSQPLKLKSERIERIIESAGIQSNNSEWPVIQEILDINNFIREKSKRIICFSSKNRNEVRDFSFSDNNEVILLIGPEGGFSSSEENLINDHSIYQIHLNCPILRTNTAVTAAFGFVLARINE